MARAPQTCSTPGCPNEGHRGKCAECRRRSDLKRPSANDRGYTSRWARVAKAYLAKRPFCECDDCLLVTPTERPKAEHVDHRDGLGPNGPRGYDPENFMAMSHRCHSRKTARENGGFGNRT